MIALDATYSLGPNLSGVGVYSREILFGLARTHPDEKFHFYYRPHRLWKSLGDSLPFNVSRRILHGAPRARVFHALNQRVETKAGPTVTTFHDLFVMTGEYSSPEFRARFEAQAREAAERSDLIITVSRFTARQVEQLLNIDPARIRVIPHGCHLPAKVSAKHEKLVLTVGAIQKRKNIARLVKAFEAMPIGWRLALAGASGGFGADREMAAVEESPRRADIDVLGYVTAEQLDDLYTRASIFAFPSLDEGFGMPVLDAMARGVPVVTSNRSALPEVCGDAGLVVDPERIDDIADALVRLADDENLRGELSRRGRERAMASPWQNAVDATWRVYEEM